MTYYNDYEEEREYVRELYWEAKGMGNATLSNEPISKPVFPKYPCEKCGRMGTRAMLKYHNEKYPDCDK